MGGGGLALYLVGGGGLATCLLEKALFEVDVSLEWVTWEANLESELTPHRPSLKSLFCRPSTPGPGRPSRSGDAALGPQPVWR